MTAAYVTGTGLWAPGFRDAAAWLARAPDPSVAAAPAELLPAALRRRASVLSRMVAEAASAAAARSGADLAQVAVVLGSAYGEIGAAVEMIRSFREGEGLPSPTRFHNSVHNTPVAYLSMATVNRGLSTAVAAGEETVAMALLEALGVLDERGGEVLVVLADEAVPAPLAAERPYAPGAVALLLSASAASAIARLGAPARGAAPAPDLPAGFAAHPCAGGFALLAAAAARRAGPVALGPAGAAGWTVDLEPVGAA